MKLRSLYSILALSAAWASGPGAAQVVPREVPRAQAAIAAAAEAFLATLDDAGRVRVSRSLDDQERFAWYFTPVVRDGLPLKEMSPEQRAAALALLQSATSSQGYMKAAGVLRLEEILGHLEGRPERRDPEDYHFWIFGTPSADQPWGWRFEGHHVSFNFTSAAGLTVATPAFIGANPARVPSGPDTGWRLLANEEDLGRSLVHSLDDAQRSRAIISKTAPPDILTGNERRVRLERIEGLAVADMTLKQRELFMDVLGEYLGNVEPEIAKARYARIEETGIGELHFAWAGSMDEGRPHYYRIHGPTVLIEYDNTQDDANHIHSVWRDLENDFGEDLLRSHYATAAPGHGHDHGSGDVHTHPEE
jgi:Protein of unknown function (DUF3500)